MPRPAGFIGAVAPGLAEKCPFGLSPSERSSGIAVHANKSMIIQRTGNAAWLAEQVEHPGGSHSAARSVANSVRSFVATLAGTSSDRD